ncbi:serine/threonine-protein kinase RIO3-like [Haliotis rubra]|uniref:serine/threonine-protein kinase RIO3-like n=1 Tax=Haliotis rubra TaxID=36100 RepID=UPI001EE629CC|nr:serine/threonine-protein kinase RIO3-like [Haliotis rubra]
MEGTVSENPIPTQTITPSTNPWAKKSTPWGKSPPVVACSLEEVMSEQLAADLQDKEGWPELGPVKKEQKVKGQEAAAAAVPDMTEDEVTEILAAAGIATDKEGTSDELIARMMQLEFDREHNKMLQKEQEKFNGTNKVQITFDNYKTRHPVYEDEEEEDSDEYGDPPEKNNWDKKSPKIGPKGYTGTGKNITTKHDKAICGRRNAEKMMMFPPGFGSGDGEGMDMQLPNHVYNKLKAHSQKEDKHREKLHEKKEHSTAEHAVDPRTRLLMYKLVNNGWLDSISGTISGGKESVVFHAFGGSVEGKDIPKECAIKVFKTTLNEFKNREQYVHGDPRFFKDDFKKQNPRKIMKLWANKEAFNLNRMKKFDLPCPHVVVRKQHVLVMSFIGDDGISAPKLKDARLSSADLEDAYAQTKKIMWDLQQKCGIVHADLSEFNMLWYKDQVYVIDVSQAVDQVHPKAMEFLYRDCCNVTRFFNSYGVHDVASPEELFNETTRLSIQGTGADFLCQVQRYDKDRKESMVTHANQYKEYAFDFHFDISQREREMGLQDSDDDED